MRWKVLAIVERGAGEGGERRISVAAWSRSSTAAQCFSAFSFSALAAAMTFSARNAGTSS